ncbi:hypothetical protein ACTWQF_34005 [Streptomyces sp. 8N114]|uniref:hypothetical protein n=1 Tax=Streptomyces sp. 8N114 TaxID=3457419 RepID=UPI003FD2558E
MDHKQIMITVAMAVVFAWSIVMAAMGHVAAIASLAPVLGLTVAQLVRAARSRTASASGHRVTAVPDKEDGAL